MGRAQHDQLRTEVDLLKRCSDHNIVRLYGTIQKDDFLWVCSYLLPWLCHVSFKVNL